MGKQKRAWTTDELILVLDLYFKSKARRKATRYGYLSTKFRGGVLPAFNSPHCIEELNNLVKLISGGTCHYDMLLAEVKEVLFHYSLLDCGCSRRNTARSHRGKNNEALIQQIWADFSTDLEHLRATAVFTSAELQEQYSQAKADDKHIASDYKAIEGKKVLEQHQRRERDKKLVRIKKNEAQTQFGTLQCEVCKFSFKHFYGTMGEGFIECHHTKPLSSLNEQQPTCLKDLALVCANCHRMLHRGVDVLTIATLQRLIAETSADEIDEGGTTHSSLQ